MEDQRSSIWNGEPDTICSAYTSRENFPEMSERSRFEEPVSEAWRALSLTIVHGLWGVQSDGTAPVALPPLRPVLTCWIHPSPSPPVPATRPPAAAFCRPANPAGGYFTNSDAPSDRPTDHRPMLFVHGRMVRHWSDGPLLLVTPPPHLFSDCKGSIHFCCKIDECLSGWMAK